jgi:lipoic acid synthetase
LDPEEPARVAEAVRRLRLKHVVITSVARDDLPDGGAGHYRRTIEAIRRQAPAVVIEVLTPDFNHSDEAIDTVLAAYPHIFNHNLETVRRLTPMVRSRATYDGSLQLLRVVKVKADSQLRTKSGLMLGLGETDDEVAMAMADLREAGCDSLTLGQYLQPTPWHLPMAEFIPPSKFEANAILARKMGFAHVTAGPLVRSSYHAEACGPFIA